MPVSVLVGMQWGDEGKGKIVDILGAENDVIARYQGGANAGHTVVIDGKRFVLHLVPSGILREGKICVIGSGVVVDPESLFREVEELGRAGIKAEGRLFISPRAHCILPVHKAQDVANESKTSQKKIGTTGKGIGPAYSDKAQRTGIPMFYLDDDKKLRPAVASLLSIKNCLIENYYGGRTLHPDEVFGYLKSLAPRIRPFIGDARGIVADGMRTGKRILCEGAQGTMLDLDHGTYPFVTSSNTVSAGACVGLGIPPHRIDRVIGVMKAYTTRVGEGPFPTELKDDMGNLLQGEGKEFGATTGRPRRCGWFDGVVARYAAEVNGIHEIALTKLDVLDKVKTINVCTAYRVGGKEVERLADDISILEGAEPVYREFPGWLCKTAGVSELKELPDRARRYVAFLEEQAEAGITIISTGQDRNATITI